jgi:hypothetical protein
MQGLGREEISITGVYGLHLLHSKTTSLRLEASIANLELRLSQFGKQYQIF